MWVGGLAKSRRPCHSAPLSDWECLANPLVSRTRPGHPLAPLLPVTNECGLLTTILPEKQDREPMERQTRPAAASQSFHRQECPDSHPGARHHPHQPIFCPDLRPLSRSRSCAATCRMKTIGPGASPRRSAPKLEATPASVQASVLASVLASVRRKVSANSRPAPPLAFSGSAPTPQPRPCPRPRAETNAEPHVRPPAASSPGIAPSAALRVCTVRLALPMQSPRRSLSALSVPACCTPGREVV